jgi:hypothetical protein
MVVWIIKSWILNSAVTAAQKVLIPHCLSVCTCISHLYHLPQNIHRRVNIVQDWSRGASGVEKRANWDQVRSSGACGVGRSHYLSRVRKARDPANLIRGIKRSTFRNIWRREFILLTSYCLHSWKNILS